MMRTFRRYAQSKLAAAITMPVTNDARQENNSNSFKILMTIGAPPMQHPFSSNRECAPVSWLNEVKAIAAPV
jgi:hypothetical protein